MARYSAWRVFREGLFGNRGWDPAWRAPAPKPKYDVVIVGGGGHGLATAYYLAKNHGVRNVAVLERGWIGGGNSGRNTTVVRSNYYYPQSIALYELALRLYEKLSLELNYNVVAGRDRSCRVPRLGLAARSGHRHVPASRLQPARRAGLFVHPHRAAQAVGAMRLRSLLFVPGDRPDRMLKALLSGADALILDLEDAVADGQKHAARDAVATFLSSERPDLPVFVRVNPLESDLIAADIALVAAACPHGVVLPKSSGGASVADLERRLAALGNLDARILPIATETPAAIFGLGTYPGASSRLCGLTWGAEDLPTAIGAMTSREADGRFTPPYEVARALMLFGAHAAGVPAIETVYPLVADEAGLAAYAGRGRRDGFAGMLAIHPRQVAIINEAFTPSAEEIAWARRVVDAFTAGPDAGALRLDGQMLDRPHLMRAQRLLETSADQ